MNRKGAVELNPSADRYAGKSFEELERIATLEVLADYQAEVTRPCAVCGEEKPMHGMFVACGPYQPGRPDLEGAKAWADSVIDDVLTKDRHRSTLPNQ